MSERFFVGAIQGLIGSILVYLWLKRSRKKEMKHYKKILKKEIYNDSYQQDTLSHNTLELECYNSLYDELKEKCNPANYMNPYNAEKVEISNQIYSQLDINQRNISELIQLRNYAIKKLGLSFSAEELFQKLSDIFNPTNYIGEKYDADKLHIANQVYSEIQRKTNDIIALEAIAKENGLVLVKKSNNNIQNVFEQKQIVDIYKNSERLNLIAKIIFTCIFLFILSIPIILALISLK
jgi:hypothetical protein